MVTYYSGKIIEQAPQGPDEYAMNAAKRLRELAEKEKVNLTLILKELGYRRAFFYWQKGIYRPRRRTLALILRRLKFYSQERKRLLQCPTAKKKNTPVRGRLLKISHRKHRQLPLTQN